MNKKELSIFVALVAAFLFAYYVPFDTPKIQNAISEAFCLLQWYAQYHTLPCVVPAMFIAGAIAAFFSKEAVLRHLGPKANKVEAYGVASVSGTVLAVCSCSVLPMFAGIYRVGAGLGPASAFLYSGPAINVMAIFLTARVLGYDLGIGRVIGAVVFAVIIGLIMSFLFRKEEAERTAAVMQLPEGPPPKRKFRQTALFFVAMITFLVFSDWANPSQSLITMKDGTEINVAIRTQTTGRYEVQLKEPYGESKKNEVLKLDKSDVESVEDVTPANYRWAAWIFHYRWYFAGGCFLAVLLMVVRWFEREELSEWMGQTWFFSKTIIPLLFGGVLATGFIGSLIPEESVGKLVGGDSLLSNFIASMIGGMWYFATLTEIPILEKLLELNMGRGPALALLLAGPALSLPSIAVIYSVIGFKKTATFVALTIGMSTIAGWVFGMFFV